MFIDFPGFPTEIGELIEFPDVTELLRQPMFSNAPAEFFYRHATMFQKLLFAKMPLTYKTPYISVSCNVRVVYPGILINKIIMPEIGSTRNEWHPDGILDESRKVHLITNFMGTEFNAEPFRMEVPDDVADDVAESWIVREVFAKDLVRASEASPTHRVVSYDKHLHRAPLPDNDYGVRFFMRVMETSKPFKIDPSTYIGNGTSVWLGTKEYPNVQHREGKVIIHANPAPGTG